MSTGHPDLIVTTSNDIEGYQVTQVLGVVRGIVVRAQSITQGIRGAFASIMGGNITAYEEVCEAARQHAYDRLIQHAREHGANAVIAMRYDATEFQQGITEVVAYGTAVRI